MQFVSKHSLRQIVSMEATHFLDKIEQAYQTEERQKNWIRSEVYQKIVSLFALEPQQTLKNQQTLSDFFKSTINNEFEKRRKKIYCRKDLRIDDMSNIFSQHQNSGSAFNISSTGNNFLADSGITKKEQQKNTHLFPDFHSSIDSLASRVRDLRQPIQDTAEDKDILKLSLNDPRSSQNFKRRKYSTYANQFKNQTVRYALRYGIKEASQRYDIPANKVSIWIRTTTNQRQIRGRKPIDPDMQEKIYNWLKGQIEKGAYITQKIIREKAKLISNSRQFKASKGWLQKFFKRRPELFEAYTLNRKFLENELNQCNAQQNMRQQLYSNQVNGKEEEYSSDSEIPNKLYHESQRKQEQSQIEEKQNYVPSQQQIVEAKNQQI